jgi:hypothetical protein
MRATVFAVFGLLVLAPLHARAQRSAALLPNGRVLVADGYSYADANTLRSVDLLNPKNNRTRPAAPLLHDRNFAVAVPLSDGTVLVAGGFSEHCATLDEAERHDPKTDEFTLTSGAMADDRFGHAAVRLNDGQVLVVGGKSTAGDEKTASSVAQGVVPTVRSGR